MADVLLCGAWDEGPGYPRVTSLRQAMLANGDTVRECRAPGLGRDKQALLRAPWRLPAAWLRQRRSTARLLAQFRELLQRRRPDCVVVPYPGHALVQAVADAARPLGVPVLLDLFLSAYDTVVEDRALVRPGSLGAWWCERLDRAACAAADLVLVDAPANAAYVAALTGLPADRFAWLPVHDPDAAAPAPLPTPASRLRLLFFGTGVPLHGLPSWIDAVAMAPDVELTLVGGTPADRVIAQGALGPRLVLEPEFVPRSRLQQLLAGCDLVAGVFGASGKAQRVVPFKVAHGLAAGRPVITADTPAVAQWLDGSGAVFLAPAGDVVALGDLLRELARDRMAVRAAAARARPTYDRVFGTQRLAARWRQALLRVGVGETAAAVGA
jgi:glycosyltransferase involved in cell wall biosynthesis